MKIAYGEKQFNKASDGINVWHDSCSLTASESFNKDLKVSIPSLFLISVLIKFNLENNLSASALETGRAKSSNANFARFLKQYPSSSFTRASC